jgi:hypothetical protein
VDGTARVWDTATGRQLQKLNAHTGGVIAVAVTPDGRRIVTARGNGNTTVGDGVARIWDAVSGRQLQEFKVPNGVFWSVAVTPDGQRIVTGGEDGTVRLWDALSGRELFKVKGYTHRVWSVAVTPDGQRIVTGGWEGTAKLWDVDSGRQLQEFTEPAGQVQSGDGDDGPGSRRIWSVAMTPDGQRIITVGKDGTARVWDVVSGRELLQLKGHSGFVWSVAVTPDGQRILTGGDDSTARLWDAVSGRELLTFKGHAGPVWSVAVTSDGRRIVTGSDDGTVKIWEAASQEQVARWTTQDQEDAQRLVDAARRQAAWQRPVAGAPGFIQDWLVLAPIPLAANQRGAEGLEREQLSGEAKLQPREGEHVLVDGREYTWQARRAKEPILDFNSFVGKVSEYSVAFAVCYVISKSERNDLLLQVSSDDQAKIYLNGKEVYKYSGVRPLLEILDPSSPVTLRTGTNTLVFKVVNEYMDWLGCLRFVDRVDNPVQGLEVRLAPQ